MTATPDRADGTSLGLVFDRCVANYGIAEAVRDGHLVPARGVRVDVAGLDLSKVRLRPIAAEASSEAAWRDVQDLHPGDLGKAVIAPAAVEGIVGPLLDLTTQDGRTMRTLVFAVDIRHARALVDAINARRPNDARIVFGAMKKRHRAAVLRDFAAGEFAYLVNVALLIEGYDLPAIECVALARPTTSRIFVAQACGRALRPAPGKLHATVIDFTTNTTRFSLVGPEDVLAGALVEPMSEYRRRKPTAPVELDVYRPQNWAARFMTSAVDLMRRGGRAVGRAVVKVTPAPVRKAASRGGRVLAKVVKMLVG